MKKFFRIVLALVLAMTLSWVVGVSALFDGDGSVRYTANDSHGKSEQSDAANTDTLAPQATGPIIADHTVVDKYDDIPQEYIDIVKTMWLNVPGESHSRGYRYGLQFLEDLDPTYAVNVTETGEPEGPTDQHLRVSAAVRNQYNKWSWGAGEKTWYTWLAWNPSDPDYPTDDANKLKNHLTYANTNGLEIAAMGFGWCWDMTWMNSPTGTIDSVFQVRWGGSSVGGPDGNKAWGLDDGDNALVGNRVNMTTYISATQAYIDHCAVNGYDTKVFFTTGPVEGGWTPEGNENRYQRYLKHEYIRDYVRAHSDAILFDYADILTWNDDGEQNTITWTDYGGTEHAIPYMHSDNMLQLNGDPHVEDGDHIGQRGALRLGKALWWMLARIAGWDGNPLQGEARKTASTTTPTNGDTVTYTIAIRNITATVNLIDHVPSGLSYLTRTLTATLGTVDATHPPTLTWTGTLSRTPAVTITYAVTVSTPITAPLAISNTATVSAQDYRTITTTAKIIVNAHTTHLPLVMKED